MIYIDAPADCPLNGECFIPKIILRADASSDENSNKKFFFSLADTIFKERYRNQTRGFKHEKYENCTELVKYTSQLKRSKINFPIKYSIASKVSGNPSSIICPLCLTEKCGLSNFLIKMISSMKNLHLLTNVDI